MNETITIARVREETKVTVPKGGWLLLVAPNKPFSEHAAARAKLASADLVNDDYDRVCIGRIANTHPDLRLVTAAERNQAEAERKASDAALEKSVEDAQKRQAKIEQESAAKALADHQKRVAEVSKENDAVRTRVIAAA